MRDIIEDMSENLYQKIVESSKTDNKEEAKETLITYLVFKIGKENYAVESNEVREILRNNEIFPLPFVPNYIKGVLNSYGEPYAVLDLSLFFGGEAQDSALFMILKNENNLSLQVSDIQEFHSSKDINFQKFSDKEDAGHFLGAITFSSSKDEEITAPILELNSVIEKIRKDIENV